MRPSRWSAGRESLLITLGVGFVAQGPRSPSDSAAETATASLEEEQAR